MFDKVRLEIVTGALASLRQGWPVLLLSLLGMMFSIGMAYASLHGRYDQTLQEINYVKELQIQEEARHQRTLESIDKRLQSLEEFLRKGKE